MSSGCLREIGIELECVNRAWLDVEPSVAGARQDELDRHSQIAAVQNDDHDVALGTRVHWLLVEPGLGLSGDEKCSPSQVAAASQTVLQ